MKPDGSFLFTMLFSRERFPQHAQSSRYGAQGRSTDGSPPRQINLSDMNHRSTIPDNLSFALYAHEDQTDTDTSALHTI